MTISSSASEAEYGKGTTIRASRNERIADWGGFGRYRLDVIEAPANYRGFDIGPTSSSLRDSETGVWNLDEYFNKATAENMIPGEYVFRVVAIGYVSGVKYEVSFQHRNGEIRKARNRIQNYLQGYGHYDNKGRKRSRHFQHVLLTRSSRYSLCSEGRNVCKDHH